MDILEAVPDSVLWLMDESAEFVSNIRKAAKHSGVDPDRILFKRKLPYEEHMQRLAMADLALDTWIVNGAATTSDALWGRRSSRRFKRAAFRVENVFEPFECDWYARPDQP